MTFYDVFLLLPCLSFFPFTIHNITTISRRQSFGAAYVTVQMIPAPRTQVATVSDVQGRRRGQLRQSDARTALLALATPAHHRPRHTTPNKHVHKNVFTSQWPSASVI